MSKEYICKNYIKYFPYIFEITGCKQATFFISRLEYWFSKKRDGFYKFFEPCSSPFYKEDDSWSEELGTSRKTLIKAFDKIGIRYKTKTEFKNSSDKFQGKYYASYYDRSTNRTFFVRNHEKADADFNTLFFKTRENQQNITQRYRSLQQEPMKGEQYLNFKEKVLDSSGKRISTKNEEMREKIFEKFPLRNGQNSRYPYIDINNNIKQKITHFSPTQISSKSSEKSNILPLKKNEEEVVEKMKKIWIENIGDLGLRNISFSLKQKFMNSFKSIFQSSLEKWKIYCDKIKSSDFLMGKAKNSQFKAWITWAITENAYEKIESGEFSIKLSNENSDLKEKAIVQEEIAQKTKDSKWRMIFHKIFEIVGIARFKNWILKMTPLEIKDGVARFKFSDKFSCDWVRSHLSQEIRLGCLKIDPSVSSVEFCF